MHNLFNHIPTLSEIFELLNWPQLHAVLGTIAAAVSILFAVIERLKRISIAKKLDATEQTVADLLSDAVQSEAKIRLAMKIIQSADALKERLIAKLCKQLVDKLPGHKIKREGNQWRKHFSINISYSEQCPYLFCLRFEYIQFNGLAVGVSFKTENYQARGNEYKAFVDSFGDPSDNCPDKYWLWRRYVDPKDELLSVERNWGSSEQPWVEIVKGELAAKIAKAFERTHEVLG